MGARRYGISVLVAFSWRCHLFMALNRASDISVADWLIRCFSVVKNPIKHSSLYKKRLLFMSS